MAIKSKNVVQMAKKGLLREAELLDDLSFTLETTVPPFGGSWSKHKITPQDEPYNLLVFLTDLKKAGEICNMFNLTKDSNSRLYNIPKELYTEEVKG
jgi:hypothetical protein